VEGDNEGAEMIIELGMVPAMKQLMIPSLKHVYEPEVISTEERETQKEKDRQLYKWLSEDPCYPTSEWLNGVPYEWWMENGREIWWPRIHKMGDPLFHNVYKCWAPYNWETARFDRIEEKE